MKGSEYNHHTQMPQANQNAEPFFRKERDGAFFLEKTDYRHKFFSAGAIQPSLAGKAPAMISREGAELEEDNRSWLERIIDGIGEFIGEAVRVLDALSRRPNPMPRQAIPANLPRNCLTFQNQADLDAEKKRWAGIINGMPVSRIVNWIIGVSSPPTTPENVKQTTRRQTNCMIRAMQQARTPGGNPINLGPGGAKGRGGHIRSDYRNAADQRNIWMSKFNFTRSRPFDRINNDARRICGSVMLLPTEARWDTSNARHRICWGVDPPTTTHSFGPGHRKLTDQERQQQILEASSAPGISRHHWGTDVDLFDPDMNPAEWEAGQPFADAYSWMFRNASTYGFVQTYSLASTFMRLGYMEERWHWSYYPIGQALLEFARNHQTDIQAALTAQWGTNSAFSHIRNHWREYMFNVDETPIF